MKKTFWKPGGFAVHDIALDFLLAIDSRFFLNLALPNAYIFYHQAKVVGSNKIDYLESIFHSSLVFIENIFILFYFLIFQMQYSIGSSLILKFANNPITLTIPRILACLNSTSFYILDKYSSKSYKGCQGVNLELKHFIG